MSTVLFNGHQLAADRRHTKMTIPRILYSSTCKVFLDKTGSMAYGMSGENILEKDREIVENELRGLTESLISTHMSGGGEFTEFYGFKCCVLYKAYKGNAFVVMTKDLSYRVTTNQATSAKDLLYNFAVSDETSLGVGTGSIYGLGALDAGATMSEAFRIASLNDPFTGPTSDVIEKRDLKPFLIKGKPSGIDAIIKKLREAG